MQNGTVGALRLFNKIRITDKKEERWSKCRLEMRKLSPTVKEKWED